MENFNIIEERENPLFKRKEVKFSVDAEITPSRAEVSRFVAGKFSSPAENIKIKNIFGKFGSKIFTITANIYDSEEDKNSTEPQSKRDGVVKPEQVSAQEASAESSAEQPAAESEEEEEE